MEEERFLRPAFAPRPREELKRETRIAHCTCCRISGAVFGLAFLAAGFAAFLVVRGLPLMMTTRFTDFLTTSPLVLI